MWRRSESGWVLELPTAVPVEVAWFAYPGGSWIVLRVAKKGPPIRLVKAGEA